MGFLKKQITQHQKEGNLRLWLSSTFGHYLSCPNAMLGHNLNCYMFKNAYYHSVSLSPGFQKP